MKKLLLSAAAAAILASSASVSANSRTAILAGDMDNWQEAAAVSLFKQLNADGTVIAAGETDKISADNLDCIWIHIDRIGAGKGNLPAEFSNEAVIAALTKFVNDGGCLYLSKHATQLLTKIGRVDPKFEVNIYGDGDGGKGTDVWTVNAQIGYWFVQDENSDHYDPSQYYDHRTHPLFDGMATNNDFSCETFGLLGTGDGTEMHREDHNCMWDFNAYQYTAEGKNTVEKFENENNAVVLGAWGHVVDHACAGIIEFLPRILSRDEAVAQPGRIIANGLAAYELAPRSGVNGSKANIEKLTDNAIKYLAKNATTTAIAEVGAENADAPREYFNLQGIRVNSDALIPGIYVVRQGAKTSKVIVK